MDFKKFVEAGIEASKVAAIKVAEIQEVLNEVDQAVGEASSGLVGVAIKHFVEPTLSNRSLTDSVAEAALKNLMSRKESKTYVGLTVYNKASGMRSAIEIATWEQSSSGYPVSVGDERGIHDCYDRESLESRLGGLLKTPPVGAAILRSMETKV